MTRARVLRARLGNTHPLTGKARARCAPLGGTKQRMDPQSARCAMLDCIPREAPLIVLRALLGATRQAAPARVQGVLQGVMPLDLGTLAAPPAPLARTRPRPAGPVSSVLPGRGALSTPAPANKQPAPTRVVPGRGRLPARPSALSAPLAITPPAAAWAAARSARRGRIRLLWQLCVPFATQLSNRLERTPWRGPASARPAPIRLPILGIRPVGLRTVLLVTGGSVWTDTHGLGTRACLRL